MPHAEIKHSADLAFEADRLFAAIEDAINRHDPAAGECKCRAYPAATYRHTHMLVAITMLAKPNRNAAFTAAVMEDLERTIKAHLKQKCLFSLLVEYSPSTYVTNEHDPEG